MRVDRFIQFLLPDVSAAFTYSNQSTEEFVIVKRNFIFTINVRNSHSVIKIYFIMNKYLIITLNRNIATSHKILKLCVVFNI